MIVDIGGRQTALAIGLKPERADGRTLESRADKAVERGAGKSQKDPGTSSAAAQAAKGDTYATAYDAYDEIAKFLVLKRSAKVALRGNPRGVSSNHVITRALGDAYRRRENARHAASIFRA